MLVDELLMAKRTSHPDPFLFGCGVAEGAAYLWAALWAAARKRWRCETIDESRLSELHHRTAGCAVAEARGTWGKMDGIGGQNP